MTTWPCPAESSRSPAPTTWSSPRTGRSTRQGGCSIFITIGYRAEVVFTCICRSSEGEADVYHDVNQQMQGISPIFPVQKAETDSPQSPSFPLSANISQQVNYYGPPSHSSFPQPAFPHHSQNFQSTSLHPSLPSQSASLHPSLASSSANLHPSLASSSASNLSQALEVVASGSAPRKRGRPRKHVDPCQGGHAFALT